MYELKKFFPELNIFAIIVQEQKNICRNKYKRKKTGVNKQLGK